MQAKTVSVYPPSKQLEPLTLEWKYNADVAEDIITTTVTNLWLHGNINGWGTPVDGSFTPSLADPQVLVHKGTPISGSQIKFLIANISGKANNTYCFSPALLNGLRQQKTLTYRVSQAITGGADGEQRNSYFNVPSSTLVVLDLRNKKIVAYK